MKDYNKYYRDYYAKHREKILQRIKKYRKNKYKSLTVEEFMAHITKIFYHSKGA